MARTSRVKRFVVAAVAALGLVTLAGCAETNYNYAGTGNQYRVRGPVTSIDDDGTIRINENRLTVEDAHGRAADWFRNRDGQDFLSDEFNFESYYNLEIPGFWDGECEHRIDVGHAYDSYGASIPVSSIKPGTTVVIKGSIRDSRYHSKTCHSEEFSVYDTVTVVG